MHMYIGEHFWEIKDDKKEEISKWKICVGKFIQAKKEYVLVEVLFSAKKPHKM